MLWNVAQAGFSICTRHPPEWLFGSWGRTGTAAATSITSFGPPSTCAALWENSADWVAICPLDFAVCGRPVAVLDGDASYERGEYERLLREAFQSFIIRQV